ncbi:MAG: oligosaccharide flippase family protein [Sarcina sp.]
MNLQNLKKSMLLKNTFMLYLLQFSTYFFSFITIPYQTRILGIDKYGEISFIMSIMMYFQLFIDFGFILSGTEQVAKNKNDKRELSKIFTIITISKILLTTISFMIVFIVGGEKKYIYILFLIGVSLNSLLPDYLYRGLEIMKAITYRTVLVKLFFTIMIFIFLKAPEDYFIIPILNIIGGGSALLIAYIHIKTKLKIGFVTIDKEALLKTIKSSSTFFYSRIASTIYGSSNIVILGFIDKSGLLVGLYSVADKLIGTIRSGLSPIADSLYPYMIKTKNFKMIKKVLKTCIPIMLLVTGIIFIFAEQICIFLFGEEFREAGNILRALAPIIVIILPNYLLGFPVLGAMGLAKKANTSIIVGTIFHILMMIFLYLINSLNPITIAISTTCTEFIILVYRVIIIKGGR